MASTMAVDQPPNWWADHGGQQQCPRKQAKEYARRQMQRLGDRRAEYCRHVIARRPGDGLGRAERGDDGDAAARHPPLLMAVCCRRHRVRAASLIHVERREGLAQSFATSPRRHERGRGTPGPAHAAPPSASSATALASRASDERPFRSPAASSIAATGDKRAISVLTFVSETEIYYFRGLLGAQISAKAMSASENWTITMIELPGVTAKGSVRGVLQKALRRMVMVCG